MGHQAYCCRTLRRYAAYSSKPIVDLKYVIYVAAGTDTTATTVEAAILYMVLYPEAAKKPQAEFDAVIGKHRLPVRGDRPELPYVTAFLMVQCTDTVHYQDHSFGLQEVMRCFPVVPLGG